MRSNSSTKTSKEEKFQLLADCIRSEQLSAREVVQEFNSNPEFYEWYKERYKNEFNNVGK